VSEIAKRIYVCFDESVKLPQSKIQEHKWIAILIDGDCGNINPYVAFAEAMQLGEVVVRRIYGNYNSKARYVQWEHLHRRYQFERRLLLKIHSDMADMAIAAEAIELALTIPEIDVFVIVTQDGGFFPLMHKLAELGKVVYWIGGEQISEKVKILSSAVEQGLRQHARSKKKINMKR
jgi:hypothetical protein